MTATTTPLATADVTVPLDTGDTALLTDRYELTMLAATLRSGVGLRPAVFELFARRLPDGHRYGVLAGLERALDAIEEFTFTADQLAWLAAQGVPAETVEYLTDWRFTGDIDAYREGELYFPHSPVLTVRAPFADAVVLETLLLSIFNHDAAVASKAARIVTAANGKPIIEMGSRRTHEQSAVAAARATWIAGFDATSNLAAGWRWGVPTTGTAAHAYTLAHQPDGGEAAAFDAQIATLGVGTTLLVDTYDIPDGIRAAVAAANRVGADGPGAIRIDSGNLADEAVAARALLDELGATGTRIVVSSDLDEHRIAQLETSGAPIDGYGVGTRVVAGLTPPGFVYKLVAIADPSGNIQPVAKSSSGKTSVGGRKWASRVLDEAGYATEEHVVVRAGDPGQLPGRALQTQAIVGGRRVTSAGTVQAREHHRAAKAELRPMALELARGNAELAARPE